MGEEETEGEGRRWDTDYREEGTGLMALDQRRLQFFTRPVVLWTVTTKITVRKSSIV